MDSEDETKPTMHLGLPKDPKKKKNIEIAGGVVLVVGIAYLWYKHKQNASTSTVNSTSTNADGTTGDTSSYSPAWDNGSGSAGTSWGGGYSGADTTSILNALSTDFSTLTTSIAGLASKNPGGAGGTTKKTPTSSPTKKGGKHGLTGTPTITNTNPKPIHVSGGTQTISGATSTASAIKVVTNPTTGTKDTAAVSSLQKALAARTTAIQSGNKTAIANATKNVKSSQAVVASRNKAA